MSASTSSLRRTFQQLATTWPKDVLRPTIQFGAAIQKASERVFFDAPASTEPTPAAGKDVAPASAAPKKEVELSSVQLGKAQETVDSLQRLLSSQALNSYPMSQRTLNPPSFPKHYQRMKEAIQKAERGEVAKPPTWSERFFVWR